MPKSNVLLHHYQPVEIEDFIGRWFSNPAPVDPVCGFWLPDLDRFERRFKADEAYGYYQILMACRQMVSIIYPANDFKVVFSEGKDSLTEFKTRTIVVSVEPVKKAPKGYRLGDSIDVICALSLHEGTHAEETKDLPGEDANQTEHTVWNIIEDVWIELLKSIEFPGYEDYFLKLRKFITEDMVPSGNKLIPITAKMPQDERDRAEYSNRINAFLLALRGTDNWKIPDEYWMCQEAATLVQRTIAEHEVTGNLRNLDRIQLGKRAYKLIFQDQVKKEQERPNSGYTKPFGNPLKKSQPQQQSQPGGTQNQKKPYTPESQDGTVNELNEKADNIDPKLVQATLKRWGMSNTSRGFGLDGAAKEYVVWADHEKQPKMHIPKELLERIKRYIEQDIEIIDTPGTNEKYTTTLFKPTATDEDMAVYNKERSEILSEILLMQHQFIWAKNDRSYTITGLRAGDLDEHLLCEIPYNDFVFSKQRKMPRQTRDLDIYIFVDLSGSMGGSKIELARKLSILLYEGTSGIRGVQTSVYGYTTSWNSNDMMELYEFITPHRRRLPQFYMSLGGMKASNLTPTAEALFQVWKRGEKLGRRHTQKLFINISDGSPYDILNGSGESHNEKVRQIAQKMHVQGHELIHIALENFEVSRGIYNHSIDWTGDYKTLIEKFAAELRARLRVR